MTTVRSWRSVHLANYLVVASRYDKKNILDEYLDKHKGYFVVVIEWFSDHFKTDSFAILSMTIGLSQNLVNSLCRPGNNSFLSRNHNRPLDEYWIFNHRVNPFSIG